MDAVPSIVDLLERVPSWVGRAVTWQPLPGGLSHHVYRVDVDGVPYVLRVLEPAVCAAGLGIPPEQEITNTLCAAQSGVGAQVYQVLPDVPAIVLEYLPGRTLHAADVRRPVLAQSIAAACRRLHAGPRFGNDFDIFDKREQLLDLCARNDLPLPANYLDASSTVDDLRAALAVSPLPSVPCHNDLLAENFIALGDGIHIVDYQLSGNNDPAFELGDIAAEADFDTELTDGLTAAYFGPELSGALLARVRLYLIASNVTWTLWFTVHHGLLGGGADFDYHAEASDKWAKARRDLDDPALGRLIDAVRGRRATHPEPPPHAQRGGSQPDNT